MQNEEIDLREIIGVLKKRWGLIAAIVCLASILAAVVSIFWMQPVYEASTKLIVNTGKENPLTNQPDYNSLNASIKLIDTYKEIIRTPAIMDKVAAEHPEFHLTSEQLMQKVEVSSVNGTQVMTLSVLDHSQAQAVKIVNAVSQVFSREILSIMNVDNVSILSLAETEHDPTPVKPNKILNVAIAFVASAMLAVLIVFVMEYMDDTIKTESDVERKLGLPTLALISKIRDEDLKIAVSPSKQRQAGERSVPVSQPKADYYAN